VSFPTGLFFCGFCVCFIPSGNRCSHWYLFVLIMNEFKLCDFHQLKTRQQKFSSAGFPSRWDAVWRIPHMLHQLYAVTGAEGRVQGNEDALVSNLAIGTWIPSAVQRKRGLQCLQYSLHWGRNSYDAYDPCLNTGLEHLYSLECMEQSPSWEANSHSTSKKNTPPFMEPEDSWPSSQELATGPCRKHYVSSHQAPTLFP